jgi:Zn-dependent protease
MNFDFLNNINFGLILIQAPAILLALTIHEYFHGWTANKLGDRTAELNGRLTLNPIAHLDVLGTIMMFVVGFGWAKPVPIDARNFKDPKKGTLLVAIAGPLSNLATAVVAGLILSFMIPKMLTGELVFSGAYVVIPVFIILSFVYGIALAIFNLIPIPPLDGSRVLYAVLPDRELRVYSKFEPYGVLLLFGLFIFASGIFRYIFLPASLLSEFLSGYSFNQLWGIIGQLIA